MKKIDKAFEKKVRDEVFGEYNLCTTVFEKSEFICNKIIALNSLSLPEEELEVYVKVLIGCTFPIFFVSYCKLYKNGVIHLVSENRDEKGDNRENSNFNAREEADTLGGYCTEYERVKEYDLLNNPTYVGNLTGLKIKVYIKNGKIFFSIAEGGHRAFLGEKYIYSTTPVKAINANGKNPDTINEAKFNKYFAGTCYSAKNSTIKEVLDNIVLPLNFVDKDFNPADINRNKKYQSSENSNFDNNNTLMYETVKEYIRCDSNGYNSFADVALAPKYINNVDGCIYFLSQLFGVKRTKFKAIQYLCKTISDIDMAEKISQMLPTFYYEIFSVPEIRKFLVQEKSPATYNTSAIAAFVRGCALASVELGYFASAHPNYVGIVADCKQDGNMPINQYILTRFDTKEADFDFEFRYAFANGILNYMKNNKEVIVKNAVNIALAMKSKNRTDGTGGSSVGVEAGKTIGTGLITGKWPNYDRDLIAKCAPVFGNIPVVKNKKTVTA